MSFNCGFNNLIFVRSFADCDTEGKANQVVVCFSTAFCILSSCSVGEIATIHIA